MSSTIPDPACDPQIGGPQPPRLWSRATEDCINTGVLVPAVPAVYNCCDDDDNAGVWINRHNAKVWSCVASDSTGDKLVAAPHSGSVFTSDTCGMTWIDTGGPAATSWMSIACDTTGEIIAAINTGGEIWISTNRGVLWTLSNTAGSGALGVAITMNDVGNVIAAVSYVAGTDVISTTDDFGVSWLNAVSGAPGSPQPWTSISSNSSGSSIVLCSNGVTGNIYIGIPSGGAHWALNLTITSAGVKPWSSVASNAVGDVLVASDGAAIGGVVYVSTDTGLLWNPGDSPLAVVKWSSVASNDVGDVLVAINDSIGIYSSINKGDNWTLFSPKPPAHTVITNSGTQKCIASDSTGKKLVAVFNVTPGVAGDVWTYCNDLVTPAVPAVMGVTLQELDMRRKAEVLQYKKNDSNMSKKQLWARMIKGHGPYGKRTWATQSADGTYTNPNKDNLALKGPFTLLCPGGPNNCAPTTNSNVPGKQMMLCMRPDIPLTNYKVRRTYLAGGTKWPQTAWKPGDKGFPVGKAGRNLIFN